MGGCLMQAVNLSPSKMTAGGVGDGVYGSSR